MELRFTEEQERFRKDLLDFIGKEIPSTWTEEWLGESDDLSWALSKEFARKMGRKGWLGIAWPKEYGGGGRSQMEQLIFDEELAYHRAPALPYWLAINRVGPSILAFGTEAQKGQHVAGITSGETTWCQSFTEPNAGSDLASLQCRAVSDGDYFRITGEKIFTSYAHRSQWAVLLARTDPSVPSHRGITYFLVDLKTPGIRVQPMEDMHGEIHTCRLYLDNARVPKENILGEVNHGWYVATATLDYERSGVHNAAEALRIFEDLMKFVREATEDGVPLTQDPLVRHNLADMATDIHVARLHAYRLAWMMQQGIRPNVEASACRLQATEMRRRLANIAVKLLGPHGQLKKGSKWAYLNGSIERFYVEGVVDTIAVGTSEIQRNVLAIRGLGLPR